VTVDELRKVLSCDEEDKEPEEDEEWYKYCRQTGGKRQSWISNRKPLKKEQR
jgi:hypothetical protein